MKKSGLIMLLLATFLVALPLAADGLSLSNDLLTIDFSETKIFVWEELTINSDSQNVAAPAVISIQESPDLYNITIADIGFEMENYSYINCDGGVWAYPSGHF